MKKLFLILGIVCIVICVFALLFAALNLHSYYNLVDGSAEHYRRLHDRAIVSFVAGAVLAGAGALCMILCAKKYAAGKGT